MLAQSNSFKPYHATIDSIKPDSMSMQILHDNLKFNQYITKIDTPNYISFKDYFNNINDSIKLNSINIYDDRAYLDSTRYTIFKGFNFQTPEHKTDTTYQEIVIFYQKCNSCKLEMTKGFKVIIKCYIDNDIYMYYTKGDSTTKILDIKKKKFKYKIYKYL